MAALHSQHAARRAMIWMASAAAGAATFLVYPGSLGMRLLVAWDACILVFMLFAGAMIARTDLDTLKSRAAAFDGGRVAILAVVVVAVICCIGAIVFELAGGAMAGPAAGWMAVFTIATILISWVLVHVMFALHYAHEFYEPDNGDLARGLIFPGDEEPLYGDFLYFSFVIGCAAQTADISVASRDLRRVVTVHCVVAFLFNSAIIALLINISASMLSSH